MMSPTPIDPRIYWEGAGAAKDFSHPVDTALLAGYLSPDARVLDFGCGYGRTLGELYDHGWRNTLGVDYSGPLIARGTKAHPQLDLRTIAGLPVDEADGAFDAALLFCVLTCNPDPGAQRAIIAELQRLLRPGGVLYLSDMPLQPDERNKARYEANLARFGDYGVFESEGGVFRHHPAGWFEGLLSDFEIVERKEFLTVTMNANPASAIQYLARRG